MELAATLGQMRNYVSQNEKSLFWIKFPLPPHVMITQDARTQTRTNTRSEELNGCLYNLVFGVYLIRSLESPNRDSKAYLPGKN